MFFGLSSLPSVRGQYSSPAKGVLPLVEAYTVYVREIDTITAGLVEGIHKQRQGKDRQVYYLRYLLQEKK